MSEEVTGLMPPMVAMLLTTLVQHIPEIASAVAATIKMTQGIALQPSDHAAIGKALETAHRLALAPRQGIAMTIPTPPPSPSAS